MSAIVEFAFRIVFRIVGEIVGRFAAYIALNLFFLFFRRTGDFLIELVTLDYFRDHSDVPLDWKPLHPVPGWASALLGVIFWLEFAAAVYLSWPWLSSW